MCTRTVQVPISADMKRLKHKEHNWAYFQLRDAFKAATKELEEG